MPLTLPRPTDEEVARLVATRRDLHQHPELAYEEVRTAALVADRLEALDVPVTRGVGGTGVVGRLAGAAPGPCVMLRADMDALPIHEEADVPFRSTVDGRMHACGHDGHTAMLLAATEMLSRTADRPAGTIKLCFQPAEEGGNGAVAMIEEGVLDDPPVAAAFGLHLWNHLDCGKVAVVDGPFMGAIDRLRIRVRGRGGHGAMPHEARDPILAAAHVVAALQHIASRAVDPLDGVVVTIGRVAGGTAFNVIPDEVVLEGSMRSFGDDVRRMLPERVRATAEGAARSVGCEAEVEIEGLMDATINDAAMAAHVRAVAEEVVGGENVVAMRALVSEDFSAYLQRVPGCFFFVGSRNEARGLTEPHHSPRFAIDEGALPLGARLLAAVALRWLEAQGS